MPLRWKIALGFGIALFLAFMVVVGTNVGWQLGIVVFFICMAGPVAIAAALSHKQ